MSNTPVHHRWILAVPVVLAVVVLTVWEGFGRSEVRMGGRVPVSSTWSDGFIEPDDGAVYEATDGAIDVRSGGVFAYAPGLGVVRANGWRVTVWGGSVYASADQNGLTVAALDVPLIVDGDAGTAVVRPGTQWTAPDRPLPDPSIDPVAWREGVRLVALPEHFVRERSETLRAWKAYVPTVDPLPASLLGSARTEDIARTALSAKPSKALAAAIRSRADLCGYSLLQPSVRDMAWAYVPDDTEVDSSVWMGLLLLPQLRSSQVSALTARKWGETFARGLAESDDPSLASAVLPLIEGDIRAMARDGYPLRALHFAQAARAAFGSGMTLAGEASDALDRLGAVSPETLRASALADIGRLPLATVVAPIVIPDAAVILPDPMLEARARDALAAKGAMFTGDTVIRTAGQGTVDVENVVFGLSSGDRVLRFRYTPDADTVQAMLNGVLQPYPVPWLSYIEWETAR